MASETKTGTTMARPEIKGPLDPFEDDEWRRTVWDVIATVDGALDLLKTDRRFAAAKAQVVALLSPTSVQQSFAQALEYARRTGSVPKANSWRLNFSSLDAMHLSLTRLGKGELIDVKSDIAAMQELPATLVARYYGKTPQYAVWIRDPARMTFVAVGLELPWPAALAATPTLIGEGGALVLVLCMSVWTDA